MAYDPTFLAIAPAQSPAVPIPALAQVVTLGYTHFSVSMNTTRRLAAVTSVNIDGSDLREVARADNWRLDLRLPAEQQAGPELYADNDFDRGHLVRRNDPVWGAEAEQANDDTFHYTVCGPQTAVLNQSKTMWLGLEDYVLDHARQYGQRISVFSGCIFADDDPLYRCISIPRRFFKVAAWAQDGTLATTGYVLDQTESLAPILAAEPRAVEIPPLGAYRTYQVPVADIAELTGLDMPALVGADRLTAVPGARPVACTELTRAEDMRW